jgi:hypothetical protein
MADSTNIPAPQEIDASQLMSEARQILGEIKLLRGQAEEHLKQAETSRKNADSEALLASNAKKYCEEHATTIAGFKGAVEADANTIATNKQRSDEALAALNAAKANVDGDVKAIEGRRKEVDQSAITISSASEAGAGRLKEIEASKESAEGQMKAATDSAKVAADAATAATSARESATKSSTEAAQLAAATSQDHGTTSQNVTDTQALLNSARTSEANLQEVLKRLAKSDETATGHEKRVKDLADEVEALKERVEGLLPGATSAGLASSFSQQRSRFMSPQKQWLRTFVVCIFVLFVLALPSFLSAIGLIHQTDQSWDATWRSLTMRLPIALPIIWLAIYAGRNYMLSLRMEEDYAYKEAISTAFEGYKREMEKIGAGDNENPTPITTLCTNILRAIAERPGRIYEGKQKDINLLTEVQDLVEKSAELSRKKLAES